MEETKKEKDEKRVNVLAAVSIGFVCIVIGLPLWWKTTTVYRVSLPYADIEHLRHHRVIINVKLTAVIFDESFKTEQVKIFTDKLQQNIEGLELLDKKLAVDYATTVRKASATELSLYGKSASISDLDNMFKEDPLSVYPHGYTIALLPRLPGSSTATSVVGRHRVSYVHFDKEKPSTSIENIESILKRVYNNGPSLLKTLNHAKGATHDQSDKASMRSVRTHPGYDLTFTLLNPQPDMLNAHWNMYAAEQAYLEPLIKKFDQYANIHVSSQYLYEMGIGVRPKRDAARNMSILHESDLPHIINPVEAYLGSHVSNNPNLNFLVYLPTRDHSPLHILHANGEESSSNAFLSPRWGTFMVYNTHIGDNTSLPHYHDVDMHRVMQVLIPHIKLLLGVQPQVSLAHVEYLSAGNDIVNEWEVMSWLRSGCVENSVSSAITLTSLADLLQKINNIVINDDIGVEVKRAIYYIERSYKQLGTGDLTGAYLSSKQALLSSEKAFFDPSLLELLYFPEDQKFAIYIPLFLPIGIPIIMSLLQAFKYFKTERSKTRSHTEAKKTE